MTNSPAILLFCVPYLAFAFIAARMAGARDRDAMTWFALGILLGPVAVYTLWRMPPGFRQR